jgi:hypothetical protein
MRRARSFPPSWRACAKPTRVGAADDVSNAFSKFALLVFDPVEVRRHPRDDAGEIRWRVAAIILF